MYKIKELLGLSVLEIVSGKQIGEVSDVIMDTERATIRGFVVSASGWLKASRGVAFADVASIGRDAVMVRDAAALMDLAAIPGCTAAQPLGALLEKDLYSETGQLLGVLADVFFDSVTGEIKGYEVSDSVVQDLLRGRMVMPLPPAQVVGENMIIVSAAAAKLLRSSVGSTVSKLEE